MQKRIRATGITSGDPFTNRSKATRIAKAVMSGPGTSVAMKAIKKSAKVPRNAMKKVTVKKKY